MTLKNMGRVFSRLNVQEKTPASPHATHRFGVYSIDIARPPWLNVSRIGIKIYMAYSGAYRKIYNLQRRLKDVFLFP